MNDSLLADSLLSDTIELDPLASMALHQQLYGELRRNIEQDILSSGDRLPSSRTLAKDLGVSRNTVISSFDQLIAEGFVYTQNGAGTFVCEQEALGFKSVLKSDSALTVKSGVKHDTQKVAQAATPALDNISSSLLSHSHLNTEPYRLPSNILLPGLIDTELFPYRQWNQLQNKHGKQIAQHLPDLDVRSGYQPLQQTLARHLATSRGIHVKAEQIFITGGFSQALLLITKVLSDAGDLAWLENPGYSVAAGTFDLANIERQPIEVDQYGLNPSADDIANTQPRFICVTSSYQYPLGHTMPIARRKKILEIARAKKSWIIEDDYDGEFRYSGSPIPALFGLEENSNTLYIGTFSKTLSPFLRTNFVIVPPQLVDVFRHVYPTFGNESNLLNQVSLAEFISRGYFARHIKRMRKVYAERRKALQNCLYEMANDKSSRINNPGGLHLTAYLKGPLSDIEIAAKAQALGLACQPLSAYYLSDLSPNSEHKEGLVLGYTACDSEAIVKAMKALQSLLKKEQCYLIY